MDVSVHIYIHANFIPSISVLRGLVTREQHFTVINVSLKEKDLRYSALNTHCQLLVPGVDMCEPHGISKKVV